MKITYSQKANDLFALVSPYIDSKSFPAKLKDDTPEKIRNAYNEWLKIAKEEEDQYLRDSGII